MRPFLKKESSAPPHRFDVFVLASDVGRVHVDPVAHAFGQALPKVLVLEHGLAALGVEAVDAVLLDLFLVPDPELALDLDLHRQSVRVPSGLAVYLVTAHRLVAAHEVLDRSRHYMVNAGLAVRRGRSLIKREVGSIGAVHALFEDAGGPFQTSIVSSSRAGRLGLSGNRVNIPLI